jgi:hypothetical protein
VGSIFPFGFEAYARLFHPATRFEGLREISVRWKEIAGATGRVAHAEMQWANISGAQLKRGVPRPGLWDEEPAVGSLPRRLAHRLAELLASHTATTDRVWFCVWDGWGELNILPREDSVLSSVGPLRPKGPLRPRRLRDPSTPAPTITLPHRRYHLFRGELSDIEQSFGADPFWLSANMCWPDDRAWFVATDIDFAWTYLGGTSKCVATVLADAEIESLPAEIHHQISNVGDLINPRPAESR